MSEHINNQSKRQQTLQRLIRELHAGKSVDEVKGEFARLLQDIGPTEIAEMEQALISEGLPEAEVKRLCDVHVAIFRESLDTQPSPETIPGHPVHTFRAENNASSQVLDDLRRTFDTFGSTPSTEIMGQIRQQLARLQEFEAHYLRKENILFPYLERHGFAGPSSVMWAIHDDIRASWKALEALLGAGPSGDAASLIAQIDGVLSPLETTIRDMAYKEENILFPTALEKLNEEEWVAIRAQEADLGYAFIQPGDQWAPAQATAEQGKPAETAQPAPALTTSQAELLPLKIGGLTIDEVNAVLTHLPLDITYVDANDRVRFFSQTQERIFPRSPAIIGRKVQKCHPPASLHRVQRILDDFRAGGSDEAEFWIQMSGMFIHIRYFAIRDEQGTYQGTLEVTQDVSRIRALDGERRLADTGG